MSKKILSQIVLFTGGTGFILTLYPPLQVPLGFLFIIVVIKLFMEFRKKITFNFLDIIMTGILIIGVLLVVKRYLNLTANEMILLKDTVYPGSRIISGGEYNLQNIFYMYMQWLLPVKSASILNNCELAFFVPVLPVILFLFPFVIKKQKNIFYLVLYLYEMFLISWLFIKYPEVVGKYTLFRYVTESRLTIIIGLLSVYLTIITLTTCNIKELFSRKTAYIISLFTIIITVGTLIVYNGGGYLNFLGNLRAIPIMISLVFFAIFTVVFLFGNKRRTILLIIISIIICGATVNPLVIGSGSLLTSDIAQKIKETERIDPGSLWVINEEFPYSNYLLAFGVKSFNALNSYPDYRKWYMLDSKKEYQNIYNRYAHVSVELSEKKFAIELTAPDAIKVTLTSRNIKKLGAKYILSKDDLENMGYTKIYNDAISKFKIYKVAH